MSPFFGAGDIDRMLARFGQDITIGSVTVKGVVDLVDESYASDPGASLLVGTTAIRVKTGAFGSALAVGATLTTDGVTYRVQRFQRIDDGAITLIYAAPK